jgi:predicted regulator of Ras-like GTPase activity (Roadblock/LC7/MglB family)
VVVGQVEAVAVAEADGLVVEVEVLEDLVAAVVVVAEPAAGGKE